MTKRKGLALRNLPVLRSTKCVGGSVEGPVRRSVSEGGFTLIELLIVIAIIALLMAILIPALNRAKEHGKRANCLSNVKQMTLAWQMYAQANDDKLVNGAPMDGDTCPQKFGCAPGTNGKAMAPPPPYISGSFSELHRNELPWIGVTWISGGSSCGFTPALECQQRCAIQTGALWKFVNQEKIYRCPTGDKEWLVTYSIVDSMNGKYQWNKDKSNQSSPSTACVKNLNQIKKASDRIVFVDEGHLSPDSYAVYSGLPSGSLNAQAWFDPPMSRHGGGTIVSYTDGHSARWMWKSKWTSSQQCVYNATPPTNDREACNDLYRMQIATWGKIGYTPSFPPKIDD